MAVQLDPTGKAVNISRIINFVTGINGVAAGAQASINMECNKRIHRVNFQTLAIAYGFGATQPTAVPATADAGATFALTVLNGAISAVAITAAVSTKADGVYPLTITDGVYTDVAGKTWTVGKGATGTYTVATHVVTAAAITLGGVPSPTPPELVITALTQKVNGLLMRDITPANIIRILDANPPVPGQTRKLGALPIYFTEPNRNIDSMQASESTSWDLIGQGTWQILVNFAPNVSAPALTGTYEYDTTPNTYNKRVGNQIVATRFLNPVRHHQQAFPAGAGRTEINSLPKDFGIVRMWVYTTDLTTGARIGKGNITQIEVQQDGNKVVEQTLEQNDEALADYGFNPQIFDAAYISDPDRRIHRQLRCKDQLLLRVYCAVACNVVVVMETCPQAFR